MINKNHRHHSIKKYDRVVLYLGITDYNPMRIWVSATLRFRQPLQ